MTRSIETHPITWQGRSIEVRCEERRLATDGVCAPSASGRAADRSGAP
ncbi:hypothetical protein [Mesorhizobium sp.]|nr:hypothetical protein [Mesorhizobium sp.]